MSEPTPKSSRRVERRHHKVDRLPPSIVDQINDRLRRGESYESVEAWLDGLGHPVGKSSLHRYHKFLRYGMERIRERTLLAQRIIAEGGVDPSVVQTAGYQVLMQQATDVAMMLELDDADDAESRAEKIGQLTKLMRAMAAMGGTATELSRRMDEIHRQHAEADRQVERLAASGEFTDEQARRIKDLYGIA